MQNFRTPNFCEWPSVVRVNNEKRGFDLLARFLNGLRPMKVKRLFAAPIFSALLLASGSVCAADSARASDEQQLTKIENDWAISYVKRDTAFLQRITSGDFAFVGPDGNMVNKADYVKSITGDTVFTGFKIEDLKIRTYGDAAVVIGLAIITAKTKGEDESGQYSFTDVFVKQKGEWKAVSGQVTPVAKDQATE
jgi:ketosteroid isomerase-like protein